MEKGVLNLFGHVLIVITNSLKIFQWQLRFLAFQILVTIIAI